MDFKKYPCIAEKGIEGKVFFQPGPRMRILTTGELGETRKFYRAEDIEKYLIDKKIFVNAFREFRDEVKPHIGILSVFSIALEKLKAKLGIDLSMDLEDELLW